MHFLDYAYDCLIMKFCHKITVSVLMCLLTQAYIKIACYFEIETN